MIFVYMGVHCWRFQSSAVNCKLLLRLFRRNHSSTSILQETFIRWNGMFPRKRAVIGQKYQIPNWKTNACKSFSYLLNKHDYKLFQNLEIHLFVTSIKCSLKLNSSSQAFMVCPLLNVSRKSTLSSINAIDMVTVQ